VQRERERERERERLLGRLAQFSEGEEGSPSSSTFGVGEIAQVCAHAPERMLLASCVDYFSRQFLPEARQIGHENTLPSGARF
jgi:hypothetical protein